MCLGSESKTTWDFQQCVILLLFRIEKMFRKVKSHSQIIFYEKLRTKLYIGKIIELKKINSEKSNNEKIFSIK